MGVLSDLHQSQLTPIRKINFKDFNHGIEGDTFLLGTMILSESEDHIGVSVRPDLMRTPARTMALFMGIYDIAGKFMDLDRDSLTITFTRTDDVFAWVSLYMSQAYLDSVVYHEWISAIEAADYLGWTTLMEESVYPVILDNTNPLDIQVNSLLGSILIDGSYYLPHYLDPYSTVSFPEAGKVIPYEVLTEIDKRDYHHMDDHGGIHIDIVGNSNPSAVSRIVRDMLTHHLPYYGDVYNINDYNNYGNDSNDLGTSLIPKWARMGGNIMKRVDWEQRVNNS